MPDEQKQTMTPEGVLVGGIAALYRPEAVVHLICERDVGRGQCGTFIGSSGARTWYVDPKRLDFTITCLRCRRGLPRA